MSRRHLPTVAASMPLEVPQHLEQARRRLGGRGRSDAGIGALVQISNDGAAPTPGVVLFVAGQELDVWTGNRRVIRTQRERVSAVKEAPAGELAAIASAVRIFAELAEGRRVRYVDAKGNSNEGTLFEKCRYGALVARDDRQIMAVGFSKLEPAPSC
ncbi:MAG TPA: hypothetical protein VK524_27290 [Polyangiaceae bacterium]|nr:hypothetical protein [Polyangiaceae bacterium]